MPAKDYMNQTATWLATTGLSADGARTQTSTSIKVRFEYNTQMQQLVNSDGIVSKARLFTMSAIQTDDEITISGRTWTASRVMPRVNFDGGIEYYEVWL